MKTLKELKSKSFFRYFEEISSIPRGSGDERGISDYLVSFAKTRNLEVIQDQELNVTIKKPGTIGYEDAPTVILQGHMDMVCEKNKDTEHDFKKDPIKLKIIGDMLYATNTTLGGDDGIALAYGLAILDSNEISHPALEILFTTEEETTMKGALNLEYAHLKGKILINIDSTEEGTLLVSSAGGIATTQILPIVWVDAPKDLVSFLISIGGLSGGHSGEDIHKGRGNSNKILGRILNGLCKYLEYSIKEINGGVKANAIPREAEAIIVIDVNRTNFLEGELIRWNTILKNEYGTSDSRIFVKLEKCEAASTKVFSPDTKDKVIASLILIPNGIQSMSMDIPGLVESSTNLGVVATLQEKIIFQCEIRSSIKSLCNSIFNQVKILADILNCELIINLQYPEWTYNADSKIRKLFYKIYKEKYETNPNVTALHAGLECGLLLEKMPYLDAISYGPNIYDLHTPDEHLSISSVERTWDYICTVLKEMNRYLEM